MKKKEKDPPRIRPPQEDILDAFHDVMKHELDRSILLAVSDAGEELGWSELHRRVGNPSRQPFQDAVSRLHGHVLLKRRLRKAGRHHRTLLSPTPRGLEFAGVLLGIAREGAVPAATPQSLRQAVKTEFLGAHLYASA